MTVMLSNTCCHSKNYKFAGLRDGETSEFGLRETEWQAIILGESIKL